MYGMPYVCESVYLYDLFKRRPAPYVLLAHARPTMFYIHPVALTLNSLIIFQH